MTWLARQTVRLHPGRRRARPAPWLFHKERWPEFTADERKRRSCALSGELVAEQDCVVITTDHSEVDYEMVVDRASLVLDTRNATSGVAGPMPHVNLL